MKGWSGQRDLNPRPSAPKADALPDCAMPRRLPLAGSIKLRVDPPVHGEANHTCRTAQGQFYRSADRLPRQSGHVCDQSLFDCKF